MKKYLDEKEKIRTGIFSRYEERSRAIIPLMEARQRPTGYRRTVKPRHGKRRFHLQHRSSFSHFEFYTSFIFSEEVKWTKAAMRYYPSYHGTITNQFPISARHGQNLYDWKTI